MLRLREMTLADLPLFQKWLAAPHVARWYRDPEDWVAEVAGQDGEYRWIHHFIAEADGRPVGLASITLGGTAARTGWPGCHWRGPTASTTSSARRTPCARAAASSSSPA